MKIIAWSYGEATRKRSRIEQGVSWTKRCYTKLSLAHNAHKQMFSVECCTDQRHSRVLEILAQTAGGNLARHGVTEILALHLAGLATLVCTTGVNEMSVKSWSFLLCF